MTIRTVYCGACDRPVPVTLRPDAGDPEGGTHLRATSSFLCLDYGVRCTGAMCPLGATPDAEDPADARTVARRRGRPSREAEPRSGDTPRSGGRPSGSRDRPSDPRTADRRDTRP